MTVKCVVDASVLVALFVPQPWTEASMALMSDIAASADGALFAPDCIFYETTAALRKYERMDVYNDLDGDLSRLQQMPISTAPSRDLMRLAATISRAYVVSTYDAFYLALGSRERLPLITADARLVNAVKGKGFDVRNVLRL
jgi:predicted nucleic acid-binding protein